MISKIESKTNLKIKEVVKLYKPSYQNEKRLYIAEGYHLLEMALEENLVDSVFTLKKLNIDPLIPQYIVNEEVMEKLSNMEKSQGVLTLVRMKKSENLQSDKVLYLDDVGDPGNVGTIFRTALAFGFKDVVLSKNACSAYNDKVVQASQGAIFKLNVIKDDGYFFPRVKNLGYDVVVTYLRDAIDIKEVPHLNKFVLVLGNEARGVKDDVLDFASYKVKIDISDIESLNVAIAGAIAMYTLK